MAPQAIIQVLETIMNHRSHNIIHVPIAIQQGIWKIIAEIPILVSNVVEKVLLKSVVARNLHLQAINFNVNMEDVHAPIMKLMACMMTDVNIANILNIKVHTNELKFFAKLVEDLLFHSPKPSLSDNPFFQPPCALALLLCAWRLFRVLGCGGVGEVDYMVGVRCEAVASALLRQSRDVAKALSEMFCLAPCALSEGRAHSLGLLQYSQHCHRSLIRARCG